MENIFSTKERIKIIKFVIYKKDSISVNNIARNLKLSKGLVSKYFDILTKEGVAKRLNGKFLITNSPMTKAIKILFNIKNIPIATFKKYPFVKLVGIYGSCAKGENTEDSDVDLWIKTEEVGLESLAELTYRLNKKIEKVKILLLTEKKIEKLKKEDALFYHSLAFGSIIIYGGKNGIQL